MLLFKMLQTKNTPFICWQVLSSQRKTGTRVAYTDYVQ